MARRGLWACLLWLCAPPAFAELPFHGRAKAEYGYSPLDGNSLESALGKSELHDALFNLRVKWEKQVDAWKFVSHYEFQANIGDTQSLQKRINDLLPGYFINLDKTRLLPLTVTTLSGQSTEAVQGLDRLYASYTSGQWVLAVGRQVLTWGNGMVFRPMDLFNPFGPTATDTEYKPGADMVYGQWLFDDGSDLQGLVLGRRNPITHDPAFNQFSSAVKWHYAGSAVQADLMYARHYTDDVLGVSVSGPLGNAVWHIDATPTWLQSGGTAVSLAANIDYSWELLGKNMSGYLEYYRNGFASNPRLRSLAEVSPALQARLARNEVFTVDRDYLAGGLRIELTPLLSFNPLLIVNLNDGSELLWAQGVYSLHEDLSLYFGFNVGIGPKGTEFGGLPVTPGSNTLYARPDQVYAQLRYYF